ncbi:putative peptide transporter [Lachnellula willkommii]|uniref:Putative peptide transporter n=1 Tax=Lachnellula willkommii TaxID=215461 RepID=A0A559MKW7_9HELO|nr:putative peptide transporter [Lachnellula willkommii]
MAEQKSDIRVATTLSRQLSGLEKQVHGEQSTESGLDATTRSGDGRIATDYEFDHLLHVVDDIPFGTWIACLLACCERFVWYAITTPLQNYLQNATGGKIPGALGLGQSTASNIGNALMISSYMASIPAAIVADRYGRYRTMFWSAVIEAIGASILVGTSIPSSLRAADQYEKTKFRVKILKSGEKVVTSRELTITYIYNAYYWGENIGALIADANPLVERYVGFWPAYLIPCCVMWLTLVPILVGKTKFVRTTNSNVMPHVAAALWRGFTGGFKMDAAKPSVQRVKHSRVVPWTESFIEEIKISLHTCRVLLLCPILWLCFNQTFNNLISQAGQMVTCGIPNDMVKATGCLTNIIVAPIIQKALYPFLTRHRIHFGPIARMTLGFGLLSLAMVYAAVLQHLIYTTSPCYDHPLACPAGGNNTPNQISVFLQIPVYFLGEVALIFFCTTGTEYVYNKAPDSMKSLFQAVWFAMAGFGSCLALAFNGLAHDPQLVTMYSILAGLLSISTILLWLIFGDLDKERMTKV